ncbi:Sialin [Araneus ventricosus]|uniref:Sialin n=1 Tax=Araneus ventricosus TaxID=182803 RepID=A0A4Y2LAC5_ARAVE|nr:Sialin [Araneus ventricosus]
MVAMVNNTEENSKVFKSSGDECPNFMEDNDNSTMGQNSLLGEKYDWDSKTQGMIMSSFFYAYFITVLTGGYFAKRFGAKLMFGAGVGATAILTLLTPVAVRWGVTPFIIVRVLEGIGEGLTYPTINTMISQWAPKLERSRISSVVFSGASVGSVLSLSASGLMCKSKALGGWPSAFYVFGAIGCFWCVLWIIFIYETPDIHPTISKEELFLIYESEENQLPQKVRHSSYSKYYLN